MLSFALVCGVALLRGDWQGNANFHLLPIRGITTGGAAALLDAKLGMLAGGLRNTFSVISPVVVVETPCGPTPISATEAVQLPYSGHATTVCWTSFHHFTPDGRTSDLARRVVPCGSAPAITGAARGGRCWSFTRAGESDRRVEYEVDPESLEAELGHPLSEAVRSFDPALPLVFNSAEIPRYVVTETVMVASLLYLWTLAIQFIRPWWVSMGTIWLAATTLTLVIPSYAPNSWQ